MPHSRRWFLRMEEGTRRKNSVLDSDEGWRAVRFRWTVGRLETARERGVAPYLQDDHHDAWLSGEAGKEILVPFPADRMKAWAISPRVNSPRNNDQGILEPIAVDVQTRRPQHDS